MKTLNLLPVFTRLPVFSAAIAVVAAFAFVSSASAAENKFDALGGVTAEALTPAAMDAIQGMGGRIVVTFINPDEPFLGPIVDREIGGSYHVTITVKLNKKFNRVLSVNAPHN